MTVVDLGAPPAPSRMPSSRAAALAERYAAVRAQTEALCAPLETEDYVVSSMPDVSPTKWHLAHTSWFWETFVLTPNDAAYVTPNPRYAFLFNSYYVQAGERHCRAKRGIVTRPTVREVFAYRAHVDDAMQTLLARLTDPSLRSGQARDEVDGILDVIELGLHHEQQHQELLLTDIKHVFWMNPMRPAYAPRAISSGTTAPLDWVRFPEGVFHVGTDSADFAFDNERPAHRVFVDAFRLASRLVTNGEWLEFVEAGGYRKPELWLSNGWATVQERRWDAPLYWEKSSGGAWTEFTLAGTHALELDAPVTHVSYYEADAFARWAGHRLPTEAEWEIAAANEPVAGTFVESRRYHPAPASGVGTRDSGVGPNGTPESRVPSPDPRLLQLYGDAWQWTGSAYTAYPGFAPAAGAIGEYNGKFMSDQWVLRGASCATPRSHARHTYRNFFPSDTRWQFTGVRLATT